MARAAHAQTQKKLLALRVHIMYSSARFFIHIISKHKHPPTQVPACLRFTKATNKQRVPLFSPHFFFFPVFLLLGRKAGGKGACAEASDEEEEEDDAEAGMTGVEKSRLRAKEWAKQEKAKKALAAKKKKDAEAAKAAAPSSAAKKRASSARKK